MPPKRHFASLRRWRRHTGLSAFPACCDYGTVQAIAEGILWLHSRVWCGNHGVWLQRLRDHWLWGDENVSAWIISFSLPGCAPSFWLADTIFMLCPHMTCRKIISHMSVIYLMEYAWKRYSNHSFNPQQQRLGSPGARRPICLHLSDRNTSVWAISCFFPTCLSRELD